MMIDATEHDEWHDEYGSKEEAIKAAEQQWDHLTVWEKKGRDVLAVTVPDNFDMETEDGYIESEIIDILWENGQYRS